MAAEKELQLAQGELQVKVFHLRRKLSELGEDDLGFAHRAAGGELEQLHAEVAELERRLKLAERPKHVQRKADAAKRFPDDGNVHFLVRRLLGRCSSLEQGEEDFTALRERVGFFGDPSGRVFSAEDLDEAQAAFNNEFVRRAIEDVDSDAEAEAKIAASALARSQGKVRSVQKPRMKRSSQRAGATLDPKDEEDEDLDGEQDVDLDEEVDENEVPLIDMFEVKPPVDLNDPWQKAWQELLNPGSWEPCENVLRSRLLRRGLTMSGVMEHVCPEPGQPGFNRYAAVRLDLAGIGKALKDQAETQKACPPLQPHQESVAFLLHPASPISRLLVDHPTGCGKTREMIQVLDGYFHDPRPKIPIFPTQTVCRNFYAELLRWPSRYRDYFCCEDPASARRAAGLGEAEDWRPMRQAMWSLAGLKESELRSMCSLLRNCLEMQGFFVCGKLKKCLRQEFQSRNPGEFFPAAPLRALGYTSAGGSNIKLDHRGLPLSSLFKVGFKEPFSNVYNRKVVVMDEAHNLARTNTRYGDQLQILRAKLAAAAESVLVGFTATPIPNDVSEGRLLLETIKGDVQLGRSDEGFVSSFPFKPPRLFPRAFPPGCSSDSPIDEHMQQQLCRKVVLCGDSLLSYDVKAREPEMTGKQLQAYCNMFSWGGAFHAGKGGCKAEVMKRPEELAPKLQQIACDVVASDRQQRTKSLVLVSRRTGYMAMLSLMKEAAKAASPPFKVATMDKLAEFNSPENVQGTKFLVLVADTADCSEGISFKAVRRLFLADVPASPMTFVQQCGRASRMYGHKGLAPSEQTITTQIYTAVLPSWLQGDPLSVWCYRVYARKGDKNDKNASSAEMESRARELRCRLQEAGVDTLHSLKAKLDEFATKRALPAEQGMPTECTLDFLATLGFAEEAKAMFKQGKKTELPSLNDLFERKRFRAKKDQWSARQDALHVGEGGASVLAAEKEQQLPAADALQDEQQVPAAEELAQEQQVPAAEELPEDPDDAQEQQLPAAAELPEEQQLPAADELPEEQQLPAADELLEEQFPEAPAKLGLCTDTDLVSGLLRQVLDQRTRVRPLVRALQALHVAEASSTCEEAIRAAETEDQRAMKRLQQLSEEFMPALAAIRESAVDRGVLGKLEEMHEKTIEAEPEKMPSSQMTKMPNTRKRKQEEVVKKEEATTRPELQKTVETEVPYAAEPSNSSVAGEGPELGELASPLRKRPRAEDTSPADNADEPKAEQETKPVQHSEGGNAAAMAVDSDEKSCEQGQGAEAVESGLGAAEQDLTTVESEAPCSAEHSNSSVTAGGEGLGLSELPSPLQMYEESALAANEDEPQEGHEEAEAEQEMEPLRYPEGEGATAMAVDSDEESGEPGQNAGAVESGVPCSAEPSNCSSTGGEGPGLGELASPPQKSPSVEESSLAADADEPQDEHEEAEAEREMEPLRYPEGESATAMAVDSDEESGEPGQNAEAVESGVPCSAEPSNCSSTGGEGLGLGELASPLRKSPSVEETSPAADADEPQEGHEEAEAEQEMEPLRYPEGESATAMAVDSDEESGEPGQNAEAVESEVPCSAVPSNCSSTGGEGPGLGELASPPQKSPSVEETSPAADADEPQAEQEMQPVTDSQGESAAAVAADSDEESGELGQRAEAVESEVPCSAEPSNCSATGGEGLGLGELASPLRKRQRSEETSPAADADEPQEEEEEHEELEAEQETKPVTDPQGESAAAMAVDGDDEPGEVGQIVEAVESEVPCFAEPSKSSAFAGEGLGLSELASPLRKRSRAEEASPAAKARAKAEVVPQVRAGALHWRAGVLPSGKPYWYRPRPGSQRPEMRFVQPEEL